MDYAYAHFRRKMLLEDATFGTGPGPGEPFPGFDLPTADGGRLRLSELLGGRPFVVTLASYT